MTVPAVLPDIRRNSHDRGAPMPNQRSMTDAATDLGIARSALDCCVTKKSKIELACEHLSDPTTDEVRALLTRWGTPVSRQHASQVVNGWRRSRRRQLLTLAPSGPIDKQSTIDARPSPELPSLEMPELDPDQRGVDALIVDASITESRTDREVVASPVDEPVVEDRRVEASPSGELTVDDESGSSARGSEHARTSSRPVRVWPVLLIALPAAVAVWSGWVGLGELTGFGVIHPLPGIWDSASLNTAITLPIGVEAYASYALYVWLSGRIRTAKTVNYAKWSAIGSLILGAAGQVAYHLMQATRTRIAPWPITMMVACLPVIVLGMGAALTHLLMRENDAD